MISQDDNESESIIAEVKSLWLELCESTLQDDDTTRVLWEELWSSILTHYTEPHRHYHTINHIHDLLTVCGKTWPKYSH